MVALSGTGWPYAPRSIFPSLVIQLPIFRFFIYFDGLNHLLVEVHLEPLLAVHLGLQDVIW